MCPVPQRAGYKIQVALIMESNREDALQAIRVAKKALQDGDQEKAKRLLQKSIRLCPTDCAKGD